MVACLPAGQHLRRSSETGKVRCPPHQPDPQHLGI